MTRLVRPVAVLALAASSLAAAAPALADGLDHEWASDSVHLAWDGSTYAVATTSFLGAPVTVPGDRASRTLEVTNGGPTAGLLEAWIVDVELTGDLGSPFFDELTVDWRATPGGHASVRELAAEGRTRVVRTELDPGESTLLRSATSCPPRRPRGTGPSTERSVRASTSSCASRASRRTARPTTAPPTTVPGTRTPRCPRTEKRRTARRLTTTASRPTRARILARIRATSSP